jgi:hypothetical protein
MVDIAAESPDAQPGTAALFCVTVYFGWRGQMEATTFRKAMADGAGVGALEEDLLTCLAAPPMGLEVHAVSEVTAALLDDTELVTLATDSRVSRIAALATPHAVPTSGPTRLAAIMGGISSYFTARLHFANDASPRASALWGTRTSATSAAEEGRLNTYVHPSPGEPPSPMSPMSPPDSGRAQERRRIPAFNRQASGGPPSAAADVEDLLHGGVASPSSTHLRWAAVEVEPVSVRLAPAIEGDDVAGVVVHPEPDGDEGDVLLMAAGTSEAVPAPPVEETPVEHEDDEDAPDDEDTAGLLAP